MWLRVIGGIVVGIALGAMLYIPTVQYLQQLLLPGQAALEQRVGKIEQFLQQAIQNGQNEAKDVSKNVATVRP